MGSTQTWFSTSYRRHPTFSSHWKTCQDPPRQTIMQTQDRGLLVSEDDHGASIQQHYAEIDVHLAPGEYLVNASSSLFANSFDANDFYTLLVNWHPTGPFAPDCLEHNPGACPYELNGEPWSIITADFNGDGFADLATANSLDNSVTILYGLGDGTFHRKEESYPVGESPGSLTAGDFNNDQQIDLAVANAHSNGVSILLQQEGGGFSHEPSIELVLQRTSSTPGGADGNLLGKEPRFITSADLDGDNNLDLLVLCEDSEDLWIFYGNPQDPAPPFTIATSTTIPIGKSPRHVSTNDIDGDGDLDIIVPRRKADDVYLLQNVGNDRSPEGRPEFELLSDTSQRQKDSGITVGDSPFAAVSMVFDNDDIRYTILVTTNDASDSISVLTKKRNEEHFQEHVDYAVGGDAEFILATDLNDDGLPDLVTGNEDTRDLSILINRGNGTFEPEARLPVFCLPDELVAEDFNRDGHQDLAVVSRENKLVVLLGLGDGRFEQSPETRVGDHPEVIVWQTTDGQMLDFNQDGLKDLATANGLSDTVSVLLGRGDGTSHPQVRYPVGDAPSAMIAVDVNQDGRTDLLTTNAGSHDVSILLGLGDGRFAPAVRLLHSTVVWGDFNGDGIQDVATAILDHQTDTYQTIAVELGRNGGRFDEPVLWPLDDAIAEDRIALAVNDQNGDGYDDLLVRNQNAKRDKMDDEKNKTTLSVLRERRWDTAQRPRHFPGQPHRPTGNWAKTVGIASHRYFFRRVSHLVP